MPRYLAVLLLLLPLVAHAQRQISVIELQQRPADEMIPIIRPLLAPGDALSGSGYKLLLRAEPATVAEVRQALRALDQAPANLLISVRQGQASQTRESGIGTRGRVAIENGDLDGGITIRARDASSSTDGEHLHQVRAVAGKPALIRSGALISHPYREIHTNPHGQRIVTTQTTQDLTGGFYATVYLQPDQRLRLEVTTRGARAHDQNRHHTEVQELTTVLTGHLGEWISLGNINHGSTRQSTGLLHRGHDEMARSDQTWIKVERLD